jgi:hypothetical protein
MDFIDQKARAAKLPIELSIWDPVKQPSLDVERLLPG